MNKKFSVLFILFALFSCACFAQEEELIGEDENLFADTIKFSALSKYTTKNIDTLYPEFLDTLSNPEFFIIRLHRDINLLTLKGQGEKSWNVYKILENISGIEKAERIDFNKKGKKELVIYYNHTNGLSFWTHGWQSNEKGFLILDLDNFTLLADIKYYSSYLNWSYEYDPDEPDSIAYESRTIINSESESYCESFNVNISGRKIILTESNKCNDFTEEITNEKSDFRTITYRLEKNYLIKE